MKFLRDNFFCYWEASPPFRIVVHLGNAALGSVPTMAEMNLHGSEVNFAFRVEKVAGGLGLPVMFTEAANAGLELETHHVHTCAVEGFSGSFKFFAPGAK